MTDYPKPQHPIVADLVSGLNDIQREFYEERAGVLEFDAGLDRTLAEGLALLEVIRCYGWTANPKK